MAQNGGAGKFRGAAQVGNDEAAFRVGIGAGERVVMAAEGAIDFAESGGALSAGLALPKENEALAAHCATHVRGIRGALAQNLHGDSSPFVVPVFQLQRETLARMRIR
jgi:hypothetical protein